MGDTDVASARFRRALLTKNLTIIREAAAELERVSLEDAARICALIQERQPESYDRAAVRWIARFCDEHRGATLDDIAHARTGFELIPTDANAGVTILQEICKVDVPGPTPR